MEWQILDEIWNEFPQVYYNIKQGIKRYKDVDF